MQGHVHHQMMKREQKRTMLIARNKLADIYNEDHLNEEDEEEEKAEEEEKKKKLRKVGVVEDYKVVLAIKNDFYSSSHNDVMESKILQRERERMLRLEHEIKMKHYTYVYEPLEDDEKLITQLKAIHESKNSNNNNNQNGTANRNFEEQTTIPTIAAANSLKAVGSSFPNFLGQSQQLKNQETVMGQVTAKKFPVFRIGFLQRQRIYATLKRQIDFENYELRNNESGVSKSRSSNRRASQLKASKKKKLQTQNTINIKSLNEVKTAFQEEGYRIEQPYELNGEKIYFQILQHDFQHEVKFSLHFSADDVLENVPHKRTNKIRKQLATENQEKIIFIPGVKGVIKVALKKLENFVRSKFMENFLLLAVVLNTAVLAMEGIWDEDNPNEVDKVQFLDTLNNIFTWIFIVEMGIKIIALSPIGYVRDKMNIFDGCIVILSIFEMTLMSGAGGGKKAVSAFRAVRIFRTFRVLRVTRLLRSLAFMRVIIKVLSSSIEKFVYIAILMMLFIIIYALLGMQMYGGSMNFRGNPYRASFDTFNDAFLVVFQLLSLENWADILVLTFQTSMNKALTTLYLVSWIFIGNFTFLNLYLAILIDGFGNTQDEEFSYESLNVEEDRKFVEAISSQIYDMNGDLKEAKEAQQYKYDKQQREFSAQGQQQMQQMTNQGMDDELDLELQEKKKQKQVLYKGIECEDSLYIFSKANPIRLFSYKVVTHHQFENVILTFIIVSSLKLAVDTYFEQGTSVMETSEQIDIVFNFIFLLEALLKIVAFGLFMDENSYLTESWSQLDCFIVVSSIIDMAFESIDLPVIKILRLLRTLRPLRFISHNVNMKMVVIALLESFGPMINVIFVVTLIWLMFAILGISLIGKRMSYCDDPTNYGVNYNDCLDQGLEWKTHPTNFDNIYTAMNTLFIVSSLEGWPNIMYPTLDSNYKQYGPEKDNYKIIAYYFVAFIFVGSFFLINLFVGVICFQFEKAQKNERRNGNIILTPEQQNWIEIQQLTSAVKVNFLQYKKPKQKLRLHIFNVVQHGVFEAIIMSCIILNILTMAMAYETSVDEYDSVLETINLVFTFIFIAELVVKIIAYGFDGFWSSSWNQFDLFVVVSSIVDLALGSIGSNSTVLKVPQLMRIVRVLRVTRLLKLVKSMRELQKLIETLIYSLPSLLNIGGLLFLVFFIYAVLGVFVFKSVGEEGSETVTGYNNFSNFGLAMITLFRCSTGEDWHVVMFDMMKASAWFSPIFFISFILVCSFVMLNLFILIIIQYFENYNLNKDNPLDKFQEHLDIFSTQWIKYTYATHGEKLNERYLIAFFQQLPKPLGFASSTGKIIKKKEKVAKEIMSMNFTGDGLGYLYFNEVLFCAMKNAFDYTEKYNLELQLFLMKQEMKTKRAIERNKYKKLKRANTVIPKQNKLINPLMSFLINKMAFRAWKKYGQVKANNEDTPEPSYESDDDSPQEIPNPYPRIVEEDEEQSPQQRMKSTRMLNRIELLPMNNTDRSQQSKLRVQRDIDAENASALASNRDGNKQPTSSNPMSNNNLDG